jgi:hypothetical protein
VVTEPPGAAHQSSTAAGAIVRLLQRYAVADQRYCQAIASAFDITPMEATALAHLSADVRP